MLFPEFEFKGFLPDDYLSAEAAGVLDDLQSDLNGAVSTVARMEFDGKRYFCTIELSQKRGVFQAASCDENPMKALHRVEERLRDKIRRTNETKFFTRNPKPHEERSTL